MKKEARTGNRFKPKYITSIVSVALVLTVLGLFGSIFIYAQSLSSYFRENILVDVELKQDVREADAQMLQKKLAEQAYTKSAAYVSKEEAAAVMMKEDPDFMELLGYNPLPATIRLFLHAAYTSNDSIAAISQRLLLEPIVAQVHYKGDLVEQIDRNERSLTIILAVMGVAFSLIALTLIDHTIRLAMFSDRFLIRSMQLVGATRWFIIKPYLQRAVYNGVISGLLAGILLSGVLYLLQEWIPQLSAVQDFLKFGALLISLIALGIVMSWISTYFAVLKYLKMKLEELY
jgi:cell division transport system permease protein